MNSFPLPTRISALAALAALPFSAPASAFLLLIAALSAIISIDYPHRYRGLRLPRRVPQPRVVFRAPPLPSETNRLAD